MPGATTSLLMAMNKAKKLSAMPCGEKTPNLGYLVQAIRITPSLDYIL
jgi:hypothetical protein